MLRRINVAGIAGFVVCGVAHAQGPEVGAPAAAPAPLVAPSAPASTAAPAASAASPAPTATAPAAAPASSVVRMSPPQRVQPKPRVTWDLLLEGAAGFPLHGDVDNTFMGRARAGLLLLSGPAILSIGPTASVGGMADWGVGGELELTSVSTGLSMQLGSGYLAGHDAEVHVGLNFALIGIEWQHRFADGDADGLFFKLRIPVGALVAVFTDDNVRHALKPAPKPAAAAAVAPRPQPAQTASDDAVPGR